MCRFKPMARYLHPGGFLPEESTAPLRERTIQAAIYAAPAGAFAFTTYDLPVVPAHDLDEALFNVTPIAQNKSTGRYYLGGTVYTLDEVEALATAEGVPGKYRTLISNVRGMGCEHAIRCVPGNWQPFTTDDVLVDPVAVSA